MMQTPDFLNLLAESSRSANNLLQKSIEKKQKLLSLQNVQYAIPPVKEKSVPETSLAVAQDETQFNADSEIPDISLSNKASDIDKENLVVVQKSSAIPGKFSKPTDILDLKISQGSFSKADTVLKPIAKASIPSFGTATGNLQNEKLLEESAAKMFDYSAMMIRKNDGIVREQQELVFEQTKRQIERLEQLQGMQVESITRILQKQVEGSRKIEEINQKIDLMDGENVTVSKNIPDLPVAIQKNISKSVKIIPRKVGTRQKLTKVIPKPIAKAGKIEIASSAPLPDVNNPEKDDDQMPPAPQPFVNNTSLVHSDKDGKIISDESLILHGDSISNDSMIPIITDGKMLIDEAIEKALEDRLDRVLKKSGEKHKKNEDDIKNESLKVKLGPEFIKLSSQVDDIERSVKHLVNIVEKQELKLGKSYEEEKFGNIIASLQSTINKSGDYSPLDKYLPVFSAPLFTNKALPSNFDYTGVDRVIRVATNELNMEPKSHYDLKVESSRAKTIYATPVPSWKNASERPFLKKASIRISSPIKENSQGQKKSQRTNVDKEKQKPVIRPHSPVKALPEQPLIPVHGTAFSILKTLLPLHNTNPKDAKLLEKSTPKGTDTPTISRSTSPVRYDAHGLDRASNNPLFIRRSSIRPATLAFFDHGVKRDDHHIEYLSSGGTLDIGGQLPKESIATSSISQNTEKLVASQATQVALEAVPVFLSEQTKVTNQDASIQYSSPDISSANLSEGKEAISIMRKDIQISQVVKTKPQIENPVIYRNRNSDQTLEERLAEWIQSEVLLNLVRDNADTIETTEKKDIETPVIDEPKLDIQKISGSIKKENPANCATQTIQEIAIQTIASEIPTQTSFENIADEEPLDVSAMDPSGVISAKDAQESEVSVTTQPSSLDDCQLVLPSMTPVENIKFTETVSEEQLKSPLDEVSSRELDGIVEDVVQDVSMSELVPIMSSSILEVHHTEIAKKASAFESDLQKIRNDALIQTGLVHDAVIKAQIEIEREKDQFHKHVLEFETDIVSETKNVTLRQPLTTLDATISPSIEEKQVQTELISETKSAAQHAVEEASSNFDESGSSAIQSLSEFSKAEGDPTLSLTITSLPTLSEGEILSQFHNSQFSQGEIIHQRTKMLVASSSLARSVTIAPAAADATSLSDPTTSSGQISSEGQVSILDPGAHKIPFHGDESSILSTSAIEPSSIMSNIPISPSNQNATMDGIDMSVTLERISAIVNPDDIGDSLSNDKI